MSYPRDLSDQQWQKIEPFCGRPEHERILESCLEGPRRAAVYTQRGTGTEHKLRHILLRQAGRWRVDSKKYQNFAGRWVRYFL